MFRRIRVVGASVLGAVLLASTAIVPASGHGPESRPMLGNDAHAEAGPTIEADAVPSGFLDQTVKTGLVHPTVIQFAPDGRVFIAEKSGLIKVFDSLSDTSATVFADLRSQVDDYWDRGLLGMALPPNFPTNPYVYVLYTYDAPIGGSSPVWNDACPTPPGPTTDGCVVSGRLSRLQANGDVATGAEQVLINDWCQQHPSHSIGTVAFGLDGALYVSGGDGASFNVADYGQTGGSPGSPTPVNPCNDPAGEGGALRSQDLRTMPTGGGGGGTSYRDTVMADAPVAYWRLGETSGTTAADQKGALPGTYTGSYALGQPGALSGDTDTAVGVGPSAGYASVPDAASLDFGDGPFTIEFWAKRSSTASGYIFNKGTGAYGAFFSSGDQRLHFEKVNTQATAQETGTTDQAWHHWAIVQGGGSTDVILYKDGANVTSVNNTTTFADTALPLEIGRQQTSTPFFGSLDEFAVYNKVLSGAQVAAHYAARTGGGAPPPPSDPVTLDGAVLRLDPNTGAAAAGNPNAASADPNARRIIAHGFRNPFRFTFRPGTNELWLGDVGWSAWEELNLIANPTAGVLNAGWPCYEGVGRQSSYDNLNLGICETLYAAGTGAVTAPYLTYNHNALVVPGETCPTASGSSVAGLAFYPGGSYPASYNGGLFFTDYTRDCIWFMPALANGRPNTGAISTFVSSAVNPVYLAVAPSNGDLIYLDFDGGTVHRVTFTSGNQPPVAVASANPTSGQAPLAVAFTGSASTDPEGLPLAYAWDFDGNGTDDATTANANFTYTTPGTFVARLRVTDQGGLSNSKTVTISVNNTPPVPSITSPTTAVTWAVGDTISFAGGATDTQDGAIPASRLSWSIVQRHCPTSPTDCHGHTVQTTSGVSSGSFGAPDHEYPSFIDITLTATDSGGLQASTTISLNPKTVTLSFATAPSGLQLTVGSTTSTTPFTRTAIQGSRNTISALASQTVGGTVYNWQSWSDGGSLAHDIFANATSTYTATYQAAPNLPPTAAPAANPTTGTAPLAVAFTGSASTDPEGLPLAYAWDFDGNGTDDATTANPNFTYTTAGTYVARLRVTDNVGQADSKTVTITVNPAPPTADVRVTQSVAQSGSQVTITATAINGGPASATALTLIDTLPAKLTFVSATASGGTCTYASSTRRVTCALGTRASGVQVPVTIITNDSGKGNVSIVAQVTTTASDPNTANNQVTTSFRLR